VIWAGKFWIAAAISVALGVGAVSVLKSEPIYQADGLLQLELRSGRACPCPRACRI
jgi:tyrosine-protein kinase Etk/Wzc